MFHPIVIIAKRWGNNMLARRCLFLERSRAQMRREHAIAMQRLADVHGALEDTREKCRCLMDENARLLSELGHSIPEQARALRAVREVADA